MITIEELFEEIPNLKNIDEDLCIPGNIYFSLKRFKKNSNCSSFCPLNRFCSSSLYYRFKLHEAKFDADKFALFLVKKFPSLLLSKEKDL